MPELGWTNGLDVEVASLPNNHYEWWIYNRGKTLAHGITKGRRMLAIRVRYALWKNK